MQNVEKSSKKFMLCKKTKDVEEMLGIQGSGRGWY